MSQHALMVITMMTQTTPPKLRYRTETALVPIGSGLDAEALLKDAMRTGDNAAFDNVTFWMLEDDYLPPGRYHVVMHMHSSLGANDLYWSRSGFITVTDPRSGSRRAAYHDCYDFAATGKPGTPSVLHWSLTPAVLKST
ncbi:hypothetical protein [Nonomuraea sp. NPDC023979]|uniref:hypothetical protein n=1 Tax=Nonomuraea sp. NPDC023979 TaxID=3154796 RepID=UPI0033F086AD